MSDIGGSLEALGFITRIDTRKYKISNDGEKWVKSDFNSKEWEDIARKGVLSYGVIIGFLNKITELSDDFSYQGLYLSYPHTTFLSSFGSNFKSFNANVSVVPNFL